MAKWKPVIKYHDNKIRLWTGETADCSTIGLRFNIELPNTYRELIYGAIRGMIEGMLGEGQN